MFRHINHTAHNQHVSLIFQVLALTRQGDPRVCLVYWNQGAEGGSWRGQLHAASICSTGVSHLCPVKQLLSLQTPPVPDPASALSHPLLTCSSHAPHIGEHPPVWVNTVTLSSCCYNYLKIMYVSVSRWECTRVPQKYFSIVHVIN